MMHAVFDPNWGQPKILINTIRQTREEAVKAVLSDPEHSLYSGSRFAVHPPVIGEWSSLEKHGYKVRELTPSELVKALEDVGNEV